MTKAVHCFEVGRPPLRGICLVVKDSDGSNQHEPREAGGRSAEFPQRPSSRVLSEAIPLYFIVRNSNGFWVAREASGKTGGLFLLKQSALRFAKKNSESIGCATIFLAEAFELDVANRGNPLVAWLDKVFRKVTRLIPDYPPPIPIRRKIFKGERL